MSDIKLIKQKKTLKTKAVDILRPEFYGYFAAWSAEGKRSATFIQTPELLIEWFKNELGIKTIQDVEITARDIFDFQYSNDGESGLWFEAKDLAEFQECLEVLLEQTEVRADVIIKPVYGDGKNVELFYGRGF